MTRKHAILGPSSASKWLNCTPSARLELTMPHTTSEAADEGTLAHSLGELIIAHRTKTITNKVFREQLQALESDPLYNKAMYEYADGYAIYVMETLAAARAKSDDAMLGIEQRLDMSRFVPEGFGTGDAGIIRTGHLDVIDLKYGKGVEVSAVDNPQLKIYALGWLNEYDALLWDIQTITLHIYQPRMNNVSTHSMAIAELEDWADEMLAPKAKMAFKGEGDYVAGKHCQFCKAKTTCKANAAFQLEVAQLDFAGLEAGEDGITTTDPATLTDEQVASILSRADGLTNWINAVTKYALDRAKEGKQWPGYKLVAGRSVRKFTDKGEVEKLLIKEGFDRTKLYKPQELIGITDMEKLTGRKLFDDKIAVYTIKTPGAPTLAPLTDKRPALSDAQSDFAGVED